MLAETLQHYRAELDSRGWQILLLRTGEDAGSLTATDGTTSPTVVADVYPEGSPKNIVQTCQGG